MIVRILINGDYRGPISSFSDFLNLLLPKEIKGIYENDAYKVLEKEITDACSKHELIDTEIASINNLTYLRISDGYILSCIDFYL